MNRRRQPKEGKSQSKDEKSQPKEGKSQPRNDLGLGNSAQMEKDAKESDEEATIANAQPRVGADMKDLKRLGVGLIHEPSEPTAAIVE